MLNEEALVLLGTLVASGFLVLGVLNLMWPAKKLPARRAAPVSLRARPDTNDAVETPAFADEPAAEETVPAPTMSGAAPVVEQLVITPVMERSPVTIEAATYAAVLEEHGEPADEVKPATEATLTLERCRQLAADGRPGEAVVTAMALLEEGAADPKVVSSLWQEIAYARDRMGDREGALTAYKSALAAASPDDRETVRRELAAWSARTARDIVGSADDVERYAALVLARDFLASAHETVGAAGALDAVRADLDVEFWPAYETHVRGLVNDRDHAEAYRLATEALADASLPDAQRQTFDAIRTETLSARIESLVNRAIRAVDEGREWEAVGALERAEALVKSGTNLSADLRDEATRQLADGYGQLGRRRVDNGEFEEALDPLQRALRLHKGDTENRDAARWALTQALQAVVEARAAAIREIAATGDRESAAAQADKLWSLVRGGIAAGVPQESLTNAMATTRRLLGEFGAGDR